MSPKRNTRLLFALVAVATALRLIQIDTPPTIDEAITVAFAWEFSTGELLTRLPQMQPHPPLYYLLADVVTMAGGGVVALRLISVVCGVATIPVVFVVGRRLATSRAGLLAAALVTVSPMHVGISRLARMYALLGLLAVISWWALYRIREGGSKATAAYVLATVPMLYTHYYGWFVLAAQLLWLAWEGSHKREVPRGGPQTVVAGLLGVPVVAWIVLRVTQTGNGGHMGSILGLPPTSPTLVLKTVVSLITGWDIANPLMQKPISATAVVVGLVAVASVRSCWPGGSFRSQDGVSLWPWALIPVGLGLAISVAKPIFRPRYAIGGAIAVYLLIGIGLENSWEMPEARMIAGGVLALMLIAQPAQYHANGAGWEESIRELEAQADEGDQLVIVGAFERERTYWLRTEGVELEVADAAYRRFEVDPDTECDCTIWVLRSWSQSFPFSEQLSPTEIGLPHYEIESKQRYRSKILYRLEPTNEERL